MKCTRILDLLLRLYLYHYLYVHSLPSILRKTGTPFLSIDRTNEVFNQLKVQPPITYSPDEFEAYWQEVRTHRSKLINPEIFNQKMCVCPQIRNLPELESDYMMGEYSKSSGKLRTVVIYPLAYSFVPKIIPMMQAQGSIVYQKSIEVTRAMMKNLIWLFYIREDRMGRLPKNSEFWPDKIEKTMGGQKTGTLTLFIFKANQSSEVRPMKEAIREKCKYGFHSIHINSLTSEKFELCRTLFSQHTLERYSENLTSFPAKKYKPFFRFWDKYQEVPPLHQDAVLVDLTYLVDPSKKFAYELSEHMGSCEEMKPLQPNARSDRHFSDKNIYDPSLYFYWFGVKCYLPLHRPKRG